MVLFKPFLISFIDAATRVVMGWRLFRYEPTTADLLLTLRMAIFAKHDPSYPFCGSPDGIQSDNGGIFESEDYADCLIRLKIVRQEIPGKSPSANGKVERFFETIQDGIIRRLHGHSDQFDGLASAKKKATPWDPLIRTISHFMGTYHSRVHSELKTSPWEAWHDRQEIARGLGFSMADVLDATMVRLQAQVQRDGVHLPDKNTYSDPCLTGLVDKTITVRVSPDRPYDRVEAYREGKFLGLLGNIHHTPEVAQQIKESRVERSIELHGLKKIVNTMAESVLPPADAAPPAYIVDPLPALSPVAAPTQVEPPLSEIPVLKAESDD
jgi:putative transposase